MSTPRVDERRDGLSEATVHTDRVAADQPTATAMLAQLDAGQPATASRASAPATAGRPELPDTRQRGERGTGRAQAGHRSGARRPDGGQS